MKTNSKIFTQTINSYILDCIDGSGYGVALNSDKDKLQFLADTFKSEYGHHISYYGSTQKALENWIMGLPSSFNVEFRNGGIIDLAIEWGSIPANASEAQKDKILANWFNLVAFKTIYLLFQNDISLN